MSAQTQLRGVALGLLAAALFGVSAPIAKLLLRDLSPVLLAGLFYAGSGAALTVVRWLRPAAREARLQRSDLPALALLATLGGVLGPVLMLWGLDRVSALAGSLLLNLEAPFTMLVAVLLFGEHMGKQASVAALCIVLGAVGLRVEGNQLSADLMGVLAIAGACLCWAFDNNLTQRLMVRDPFSVVRVKALTAAACNLSIGLMLSKTLPETNTIVYALIVGALSYGVSVVLDAYALRALGAAREAACFATAPFLGAALALLLFPETMALPTLLAMLVMVLGVVLLLRERHSHLHRHEPLMHEHAHTHDEHHHHEHAPGDPQGEPHSHLHQHAALTHDHPHVPDLHHRHSHE